MNIMHDYLKKIIENKKIEVTQLKTIVAQDPAHPIHQFFQAQENYAPKHRFKKAITRQKASLIAEIKRKSPSKNTLAEITDPVSLAKQYVAGGASAISVLTDAYGFDGSIKDLKLVSAALKNTDVAVLRKDFMIDLVQIAESMIAGADAILLIVTVLKERTAVMLDMTKSLGIDAIVEVHDKDELNYAVSIGAEIIGVNNRDLSSFDVDPRRAFALLPHIPNDVLKIAESGMQSSEAAAQYIAAGFDAVLIGEALVRSGDPGKFIEKFRESI